MLRIRHCLGNWLTDDGKVVNPMHRQRSTPHKQYFSASGINFCWRLSKPQGLVQAAVKRIGLYSLYETLSTVCTAYWQRYFERTERRS
jgi:hypothetical protein